VTSLGLRLTFRTSGAQVAAAIRPEAWPSLTSIYIEVERFDWCLETTMPGWLDELAEALAPQFPRVSRLEIARVALYERDGDRLRLVELGLPAGITSELVWTSTLPHVHEAQARWFAWLDAQRVPIAVESAPHADEVRKRVSAEAASLITVRG
jgi:hypothetical protein